MFFNDKYQISEMISPSHSDKLADQIADLILDLNLKVNPKTLLSCEVLITNNKIIISGEIQNEKIIFEKNYYFKEIDKLLIKTGYYYHSEKIKKFSDLEIYFFLQPQSPELNKLQKQKSKTIVYGDQNISFGYATDENNFFLPWSYVLAREIISYAYNLTGKNLFPYALFDMKVLVIIEKKLLSKKKVNEIIFSCQHQKNFDKKNFFSFIRENVIDHVLKKYRFSWKSRNKLKINTAGLFITGGPFADTGITGRKIMCDSFGTIARHGGGSFSGKDYTKPDRSGAFLARYIAKNVVASGLMSECEVKLAFVIGKEKISYFEINGKKNISFSLNKLEKFLLKKIPQTLNELVSKFFLWEPKYQKLSKEGPFGKLYIDNIYCPWEETDLIKKIKDMFL